MNRQQTLDFLKSIYESNRTELSEEEMLVLKSNINSEENYAETMAALWMLNREYGRKQEECSNKAKAITDGKKIFEERQESILKLIEKIFIEKGQNIFLKDDMAIELKTRAVIESDDEAIIEAFQQTEDYIRFKGMLPSYMKLTIKIDKNLLKAYMKQDVSFQANNPEWVHSKTATSIKIK